LTGKELLLVWNHRTGNFDIASIVFIHTTIALHEIIHLYFSDGTEVKVIYEHAFWDFDLNRYVYMRNDASKYIGHWYNKQSIDSDGNLSWNRVQLVNVGSYTEYTTAWSPVTYEHLNFYVNGLLSMPGDTEGIVNIFEVDAETLVYNWELLISDIEEYGLFTYSEFSNLISEDIFCAFQIQYLKIAIGKDLITIDGIYTLIERYSEFWTVTN
jgi:hypothetical protein